MKLLEFVETNKIDPCLKGWVDSTFHKRNFPAKISTWTPAQVSWHGPRSGSICLRQRAIAAAVGQCVNQKTRPGTPRPGNQ